jgi:hypothetical protein
MTNSRVVSARHERTEKIGVRLAAAKALPFSLT